MAATKAIAAYKLPNYNPGKVEVQYFHDHATLTSAVCLNQSPAINVTARVGSQALLLVQRLVMIQVQVMTKYNAGISVTSPDYKASIILSDNGDTPS